MAYRRFEVARSEGIMSVGEPRSLANAGKLPPDAPGGVRSIVNIRDNPDDEGYDRRGAGADKRNRGALARTRIELVSDQEADTEANRCLGERNDARYGEVVTKFIQRNERHLIAQPSFVVWDFQLQMETARVLGIDPGEVRVGVALSDDLGMLAHPLETINVSGRDPCDRIAELVMERAVRAVVVGVPRNMDGSFGPAAEKARSLIEKLRTRIACEVIPWDERLTTVSARQALRQAGRKEKNQRPVIDQVAAQILLQSWLDSQK
jgi:putative Holliday junction resolvase